MGTRRPRTRYERTRSRIRRQLRADLTRGPVAPEDSALVKALTEEPANGDQTSGGVRVYDLPAEHPESMLLELSPADEADLAALCTDLWPRDEYAEILAEDYRRRNGGAS
jgi:hypothetical protein